MTGHRVLQRILGILLITQSVSACESLRGIGSARVFKEDVGYVFPPTESFAYKENEILCIQPPAEAARTSTETFKGNIQATAVAGGGIEATMITDVVKLTEREQILQGLRDREHFICHSLAIDAIDKSQYNTMLEEIISEMQLISANFGCVDSDDYRSDPSGTKSEPDRTTFFFPGCRAC